MRRLLTSLLLAQVACHAASAQQAEPGPAAEAAGRTAAEAVGQLAAEAADQLAAEDESHYEYLKDLEWLIGEWIDEDEGSSIKTVCAWTKNRNFITRTFSLSFEGEVVLEGTQVIGWDPERKRIRSWMFDSEGGFGDGLWLRKGNQWIVKSSQVLKGGKRASAINVMTLVDDKTLKWRSIGREIDGELLPNVPEVTIVRKPSEEPSQ